MAFALFRQLVLVALIDAPGAVSFVRTASVSLGLLDSLLLHVIERVVQINGRVAMVRDLANLVQDRLSYRFFAFLFATIG